MQLKELDSQIKSGKIGTFYLFYGEEGFLASNRIKSIKKRFISADFADMNYICIEGKEKNVDEIIGEIETFPIMSDRKLVVLKNTGILSNAKLTEYKKFKSYAQNLPDYAIIIMLEGVIEKKKLNNYNWIDEIGEIVEFKPLSVRELEVWLEKWFESAEKRILDRDISYFIRIVGTDMSLLYNETVKLIEYCGEKSKITRNDIDEVAVKNIECAVFDLMDDIVENRNERVMEELKLFRERKENASVILSLITTKLSEMLMVKQLRGQGVPSAETAKYFEVPRPVFVVNKIYEQSRVFGEKYLKRMIKQGFEYDIAIKNGKYSDWTALTMFACELVKKQ